MSHSTQRHGFSYRRFFGQVPRTLASPKRTVHAGFTLLELMIAAGLSAFLMLMVSEMSADLWRSMASNARDVKVSGEATFALE
ncbi:MAG: prepilin-type N-terminal cleavage/methylation domain-containing protein, partial [Planctomycetes bacterium]|nr:prepilin-type N-terminal cleavage/methylation domain-containing protein [Planctomycetota bacterium]